MRTIHILRKKLCFVGLLMLLFIFTSCGFNGPSKIVEKFLNNVKGRKILEISDYLKDNEYSESFNNFMGSIMNSENLESEFVKLNGVMLDKVSSFTYEIIDNSSEDGNATVSVKFKYFNLFDAYKGALSEFLTKSLDFDNLDELYSSDYIIDLLIKYINNLSMEEKVLDINLVNDSGWKIVMNTEILELLTANSIKLVSSVKENIPVR